jgi:hypothetical protein
MGFAGVSRDACWSRLVPIQAAIACMEGAALQHFSGITRGIRAAKQGLAVVETGSQMHLGGKLWDE